jgi:small subunit ribosomal protein S2
MPKIPELTDMLKAGMHFGHNTSNWHPKMAEFIFGARKGVHIIDLEKTQTQLEDALSTIKEITSRGGIVLFVGTKNQAKSIVKKYADACAMPYVTERWLGGTLTNFKQIKESLKRLKMLKDQRDKGELKKYTKKEQLMLEREIEDMEHKLGGIENMTRVPDAMFVVDARNEKTALKEASTTKMRVIAMCDTNVNPRLVTKIIPSNDDAVKSIELVCSLVCDAVKEGKAVAAKTASDAKATTKK